MPLPEPRRRRAGVPPLGWVLGLPLLRVVLVGLAAAITWLLLAGDEGPGDFPPEFTYAALTILPINLISLWLVRRALHREGIRARDLIDFSWRRLGTDVLWGLLWLAALSVPFALTMVGVLVGLEGVGVFERFDTIFVGAESSRPPDRTLLTVTAVVTVLTFAPLNAPDRGAGVPRVLAGRPATASVAGVLGDHRARGDLRAAARLLRTRRPAHARLCRSVLRVGTSVPASSCGGSGA